MYMFRRKKEDPRAYKSDVIGKLVVERVQMPHSLTEHGGYWEVISWVIRLRVDTGPILMERDYICGDDESIAKMTEHLRPVFVRVEDEWEALLYFYQDFHGMFPSRRYT